MGATAATALALGASGVPRIVLVPAMAIAGALAGGVWAGIAAWLRRRFGVLEVISTILLNFVAASLVSWAVRGPLQESTRIYPMTETFVASARWPFLIAGQRLHLGVLIGIAAAIAWWWVLSRTAAGFAIRATGAGAEAARVAGGVDVERVRWRVFLLSGACAGLAGASEVGGVTWALYEGLSPGHGYTAIAVALLAGLDPRWILGSAVLFGALEAGGASMQREAGVPSALVQVVVAALLLGILALARTRALKRSSGAQS
jgi:simple sugar transport system permease protein